MLLSRTGEFYSNEEINVYKIKKYSQEIKNSLYNAWEPIEIQKIGEKNIILNGINRAVAAELFHASITCKYYESDMRQNKILEALAYSQVANLACAYYLYPFR